MENITTPDWKQILEQFRSSGQSARKFAANQGVNYNTLNYHIRKDREQNMGKNRSRFVRLPVHSPQKIQPFPEIRVTVEAGSATIRINFDL